MEDVPEERDFRGLAAGGLLEGRQEGSVVVRDAAPRGNPRKRHALRKDSVRWEFGPNPVVASILMTDLSEDQMRKSRTLPLLLLCLLAPAVGRALSSVSPADAPNATPGLLRELNRGAEELRVLVGVRDGTPSAKRLAGQSRSRRRAGPSRPARGRPEAPGRGDDPAAARGAPLLRELLDARRHGHEGSRDHAREPSGRRLGGARQAGPSAPGDSAELADPDPKRPDQLARLHRRRPGGRRHRHRRGLHDREPGRRDLPQHQGDRRHRHRRQ